MSQADTLLRDFEAERASYEALLALVQREQHALRRADAGEVEAIAHDKQVLLLPLTEHARVRADQLNTGGYKNNEEGMRAWIGNHASAPALCLAAWKRIVGLVEEIRRCNRLNGELIELQMRYFSLALHALHSAGREQNCYGADGRTQSTRATRPFVAT